MAALSDIDGIRAGKYLYLLISIKFLLDLLSINRNINFIFFSVILLFGFLKLLKGGELKSANFIAFCMLAIYFLILSAGTKNYEMALKFIFGGMFLLVVYLNVIRLSLSQVKLLIDKLLLTFTCLLLVNFVISYIFANPRDRIFYGFEHANLLGSYLLFGYSLILLVYKKIPFYKSIYISTVAFITTSTGALVLSCIFWIRSYKTSLVNYLVFTIGLIASLIFISWITYEYFYELHYKLFYTFYLIDDVGLSVIREVALSAISIQYFGTSHESSLLWRIYAYFIFFDSYINSDIFTMIFGRGLTGYQYVWFEIAPHNDFLLVLIDFGLFGFLLLMFMLYKLFLVLRKIGFLAIGIFYLIVLRLAVENNIYSFYVLTNLMFLIGFCMGVGILLKNKGVEDK